MAVSPQLPFDVPRTLAVKNSANFPTAKLEWPSPDMAIYEPTKTLRRVGMVFTVAGIAGGVAAAVVLLFCLFTPPDKTHSTHSDGNAIGFAAVAAPAVIAVFFSFFGTALARGWGGTKRIVFDHRQKMIFKEAKKLAPVWEGGIPFRAVAAVQLVCDTTRFGPFRIKTYNSGNDFLAFEMNLVLSTPKGERVNLASHAKGDLLRAEATEIAKFLGVPLLDHTDGAKDDAGKVTPPPQGWAT